jgi:hypothetical protein
MSYNQDMNTCCDFKECKDKTEYMWFPRRNPGPLFLCSNHFQYLIQVHDVKEIQLPGGLKTVMVIGEADGDA